MDASTLSSNTPRAAGLRSLVLVCAYGLIGCAPAQVATPAPVTTAAVVADTMTLVLLGTTDVHGRLYPHDYYTDRPTDHGLALLAPLVDSIRAAHAGRTLLFDSGDLLQGNPLGMVYARVHGDQPSPIIRAMNVMGYSASAIGNHEFNYGLEHLGRAITQAQFPFVAANIFRAGTNTHAYRPYALIPIARAAGDTVMVGVTGNTPPGVHVWDRHHVEGVLEFRDVVSSVQAVVADMRRNGADVIVVLSHGGLEGTSYDTVTTRLPPENAAADLAKRVPDIDVIFLGHTHRELADTTINGVLLTQARNWAASLAVATLQLERRDATTWRVARKGATVLRARPSIVSRVLLDSVRWEHERTRAYVQSPVGRSTARMATGEARVRDTPAIDFINEVQRRVSGADLSASAAFQLQSAIPAGNVTIADVAGLYPYDNTLKAIRITGAQLRAYLEKSAEYYHQWRGDSATNRAVPGYNFDIISGADYTLDISRPVGSRVVSLQYRGAPVRDNQTFTLALNNYRQAGGGGYAMIAGAPVVYDRQEDVRDLLIDEIRTRGTISPQDYFRESWRLIPTAAADAALREQLQREPPVASTPATLPARKRVRVLATNDFHGNLSPLRPSWSGGRDVGGAAALATFFALEAAAFDGVTLLLDGGDVMQGTPVSNLTRGRSTIEYYNMVGYAGAAVGNHEFDWSTAVLRERMAQAKFPWLAANVLVTGSDTTPSWLPGTAIIERNGIRVALLGLITQETPTATMAEYVAGLTFADGAEVMNRVIPRLRAQGVDFVIVVAHAGGRCPDEVTECTDEMIEWLKRTQQKPDLVVAGHTHEVVRTRVNGVPVIETGSYGTRYGVVDLERVSADSVDVWIRGTPAAWTDMVTPDSAIAALVERTNREVGPQLDQVIGTAAEPIERGSGENPMGRMIADGQRRQTGADVVIMNAGGVRAHIDAGPITWGELFRVQPFGNKLMVLKLRGSDLRAAFEHALVRGTPSAHISGAVVMYDSTRAVGARVQSMVLSNGQTVRDDGIYTVVVSDFMFTGGDGYDMLARAVEHVATGLVDLDVLVEYVRTSPQPVRAPLDERMRQVTPRDR